MKKISFLLLTLLAFPSFADIEFHSYGGFNTVVNGFTYMKDVFGGSNYDYVVFAVIVLAVLFTSLVGSTQGLMGKKKGSDVISSLFLIIFGFTIYKASVLPTTTLHIYDETLNKYETVEDIPILVAHAANAANVLERLGTAAFSGSAVPRNKHGGGSTIELISKVLDSDPIKDDEYLSKSIDSFLEHCLPPAKASSTGTYGTFDEESLLNNTSNMVTELEKLKSKFVTTLTFDSTNKIGSNTTCWNAWDSIVIRLNDVTAFDQHYSENCQKIGYSDVADLPICKERIQEISEHLMDGSGLTLDTNTIAKNQALAQRYYHSLASRPSTYVSNIIDARQQESGMSVLVAANQWLPTIRYSTMMIIVGIIPFLVLMFMTPMLGKALKYVFGLLLFIAIWGLCDAAIHGITMSNVQDQLSMFANTKLSVYTYMTAPTELQKAIATMGKMQSMGLLLATLLMGVFFGISGHAFSNIGEKIQSDIDRSGADAGKDTFDPNQRQRQMDGYSESQAKSREMQNMGTGRYRDAYGDNAAKPATIQDAYYQKMGSSGYSKDDAYYMQTTQAGGSEAGRVSTTEDIASQNNMTGSDLSYRVSGLSTEQNYENVESTDNVRDQLSRETGLNNIDHLTNQGIASSRSGQANYTVQNRMADQNESTPIRALEESTESSMADSVARHIALTEIQDLSGRESLLSAAENQATMGMRFTVDKEDLERMRDDGAPIHPQSIEDAKHGPVIASVSTDINSDPIQVDTDTGSGAKRDTRSELYTGYDVTRGALDQNEILEDAMIKSALGGDTASQIQLGEQYDAETFITLSESDIDNRDLSIFGEVGTPSWMPVGAGTKTSGTTTDQDSAAASEKDLYSNLLRLYSEQYQAADDQFGRDQVQEEFERARDMIQDAANNRSTDMNESLESSIKNPSSPDIANYGSNAEKKTMSEKDLDEYYGNMNWGAF